MIEISTMSDITLLVSLEKCDCVCRDKKHRLESKQLVDEILTDSDLTPLLEDDVRKKLECFEGRKKVLTFDEVLGKKDVCKNCTRIYLLYSGDIRGEGIVELFLNQNYPLGCQNKHRSINTQ